MRVDTMLKKVIQLAQARGWKRETFIVKVKHLWGETKDVREYYEHAQRMYEREGRYYGG